MPTQAEFDRVNKHIIDPIKRHWAADFDAQTIDDFIADLAEFTESDLQSAMRKVKREQKRRPSLAHVYEACRGYSPAKTSNRQIEHKGFHCQGHAETQHSISAREILESPTGQQALRIGVGRELMVEYEISGRKEFDEAFVTKAKTSLDNSILALRECEAMGNKDYPVFMSMFEESQNREKRLYAKFCRQAA